MEQAPQEQPMSENEAMQVKMRKFMLENYKDALGADAELLKTPEGVAELQKKLQKEIWEKQPEKGKEN